MYTPWIHMGVCMDNATHSQSFSPPGRLTGAVKSLRYQLITKLGVWGNGCSEPVISENRNINWFCLESKHYSWGCTVLIVSRYTPYASPTLTYHYRIWLFRHVARGLRTLYLTFVLLPCIFIMEFFQLSRFRSRPVVWSNLTAWINTIQGHY